MAGDPRPVDFELLAKLGLGLLLCGNEDIVNSTELELEVLSVPQESIGFRFDSKTCGVEVAVQGYFFDEVFSLISAEVLHRSVIDLAELNRLSVADCLGEIADHNIYFGEVGLSRC